MPLDSKLSDVFLMIRVQLWVWERMTTEEKCHLHHIISRVCTMSMIYDIDVDLDHLAEIVFAGFLHCKVTLYPPFCTIFFGGSCEVRLTLKG